jgi:hypothetical protein
MTIADHVAFPFHNLTSIAGSPQQPRWFLVFGDRNYQWFYNDQEPFENPSWPLFTKGRDHPLFGKAGRRRFCKTCRFIFDGLVKSRFIPFSVIPAEAGIQPFRAVLDPGVRRGDGFGKFLQNRHFLRPLIIQTPTR